MSGNLAVTNTLAALSGTQPVSKIDTNFTDIATYVNDREITLDVVANRPAAAKHGRYFYATDTGILYVDTGVAWQALTPSSTIPFSVSGLALSNDAGTPTTSLDIAAGAITSDDATVGNRVVMTLATAFVKKMGTAWAVGTGNGGSNTGALAVSTWYDVFVIQRPDTGVVDVISDVTLTPVLPANYTKKCRIGSFLTDGAGIIVLFKQTGRWIQWGVERLDVNKVTVAVTTRVLRTLSVPPRPTNIRAKINWLWNAATFGGATAHYFVDPNETDTAVNTSTAAPAAPLADSTILTGAGVDAGTKELHVVTGQMAHRCGSAGLPTTNDISVTTVGYYDPLGDN